MSRLPEELEMLMFEWSRQMNRGGLKGNPDVTLSQINERVFSSLQSSRNSEGDLLQESKDGQVEKE